MNGKGIRTIILSTSIGITKYNKEIRSEAISGKRLLTANRTHVMRAIEIAKEQHSRGLNFVIESVGPSISDELGAMIKENELFVIEEYYPVYKGVYCRWRITRTRRITNNRWICDNVNRTRAGRRIARTKENSDNQEISGCGHGAYSGHFDNCS